MVPLVDGAISALGQLSALDKATDQQTVPPAAPDPLNLAPYQMFIPPVVARPVVIEANSNWPVVLESSVVGGLSIPGTGLSGALGAGGSLAPAGQAFRINLPIAPSLSDGLPLARLAHNPVAPWPLAAGIPMPMPIASSLPGQPAPRGPDLGLGSGDSNRYLPLGSLGAFAGFSPQGLATLTQSKTPEAPW